MPDLTQLPPALSPTNWPSHLLLAALVAGLLALAGLYLALRRASRQRRLLSDALARTQAALDRGGVATQPPPSAPLPVPMRDAALDSAGVALIDWPLRGGRVSYRGTWVPLVGEAAAPLLASHDPEAWLRLVHPRDLTPLQGGLAQLVAGELPRLSCELRILGGSGGARWVRLDARVHDVEGAPAGTSRRLLATLTDVHARRQLERALQAERRLLANGPVWLLHLDPAPPYRVRETSSALLDAVQRPLLGQPFADALHGEDVAAFLAAAAQFGGPTDSASCELRLRRRDGEHWFQLHLQPERDDDALVALRGYLTSIDALKQAQAQAAARSRLLQQQVQKMTANQRFMHGLQQLTEMLQACENMAQSTPVLQDAGPELMPRFAGEVVLASSGKGNERIAAWGEVIEAPARRDGAPAPLHDCWAVRRGRLHAVSASEARRGLVPVCGHFGSGPRLPAGIKHTLCAPLRIAPERMGALHLATRDDLADESQRAAAWSAETLADALTLSLANLHLRGSLREQALRDWMTGLFNRRHFDEALQHETSRAERSGDNLVLGVLDIDHFKTFNDTYGHDAGDEVIKAVAAQLMGSVRSYDTTCRIGGEELAVLMPRATTEEGRARLDALRRRIAALQLVHNGEALPSITVSIGVADLMQGDGHDLQRRADVALYAAKRGGRNRVICWTDELGNPSEFGSLEAPPSLRDEEMLEAERH